MFDELLEYSVGHRANMSADESRFDHMLRVANAGHENLRGKIVVFIDREDLSNKLHTIGTDIVQTTNKGRDAPCPRFRGQQGLSGRETQGDVDPDAFAGQLLRGLQPFGDEGTFHYDILVNLG